jgi:hypothetical protein
MKRFLKVKVSKTVESEVYMLVDDNDVCFTGVFDKYPPHEITENAVPLLQEETDKAVLCLLRSEDDWEDQLGICIDKVSEVDKKEFLMYQSWNARTSDQTHRDELEEPDAIIFKPDRNQKDLFQ